MSAFDEAFEAVNYALMHESIPKDEAIIAAARACGLPEIESLIQSLDDLDDADLDDDAGDVRDDYWRIRVTNSNILGHIGALAVEPLIQALHSDNPQTRLWVARALGMIGDKRAFDPIVAAADKEQENIDRIWILSALGGMRDERAIDILLPYLIIPKQLNHQHIVSTAAKALGKTTSKRVIEPLAMVLAEHEEWYARIGAVDGLAHIKDWRSIEALRKAMNDDPDVRVRDAARTVLDKLASSPKSGV